MKNWVKKIFLWRFLSYLRWGFSFRRRTLYVWDLDVGETTTGKSSVVFRVADWTEVSNLSDEAFDYDDEGRAYCEERVSAGDQVVFGYIDDEPVFYCWVMFGEIDLYSRNYRPMRPDSAYSYKGWTKLSHRGKGIMTDYYLYLSGYLRENGYSRIYGAIEPDNVASIKSHLKVGFRPVAKVYLQQIPSWTYGVVIPRTYEL